jgi:hypothetical protein
MRIWLTLPTIGGTIRLSSGKSAALPKIRRSSRRPKRDRHDS